MKVILHIDIDAFFASCEENKRPELRVKPIAISANNKKSVVSTANYIARKQGIHSAMPLFKAKKLCKDLLIIRSNISYYRKISNIFFDLIYKKYTKQIEQSSIDECFIDATNIYKKYGTVKKLAISIKKYIKEKLNLNITIGISYNKFLAKMATNLNKPNGIGIIKSDNFKNILFNLKIIYVYGLGKELSKEYNRINIFFIKDLYYYLNEKFIHKEEMSKKETEIYLKLSGKSTDKINTNILCKSVSKEITLLDPINIHYDIMEKLKYLSEKISIEMKIGGYVSNSIKIKIKYKNKKIVSKQMKINKFIYKSEDIYNKSYNLFNSFWNNEKIYLIGISLGNIKKYYNNNLQLDIYNYKKNNNNKSSKIQKVIKNINKKYDKKIINLIK